MTAPSPDRALPVRTVRGGGRVAFNVTRGTVGRVQPVTPRQWVGAALLVIPALAVMLVLALVLFLALVVVALLLALALPAIALLNRRSSKASS